MPPTDATRLAVLIDGGVRSRDYGHTKLGALVRKEPYVEVKDVPGPAAGLSQLRVRLKPTARKNTRSS